MTTQLQAAIEDAAANDSWDTEDARDAVRETLGMLDADRSEASNGGGAA